MRTVYMIERRSRTILTEMYSNPPISYYINILYLRYYIWSIIAFTIIVQKY